jgi:hypothetical protein
MSKHRGSKSCPDLCVLRKVRLRCIQKTSQPVEKLLAELMEDPMSLTMRRFLRVDIQVKEEKEYANGKRGGLRLT